MFCLAYATFAEWNPNEKVHVSPNPSELGGLGPGTVLNTILNVDCSGCAVQGHQQPGAPCRLSLFVI
jgi:hypothetical protein